jgi:hypothetical protein
MSVTSPVCLQLLPKSEDRRERRRRRLRCTLGVRVGSRTNGEIVSAGTTASPEAAMGANPPGYPAQSSRAVCLTGSLRRRDACARVPVSSWADADKAPLSPSARPHVTAIDLAPLRSQKASKHPCSRKGELQSSPKKPCHHGPCHRGRRFIRGRGRRGPGIDPRRARIDGAARHFARASLSQQVLGASNSQVIGRQAIATTTRQRLCRQALKSG